MKAKKICRNQTANFVFVFLFCIALTILTTANVYSQIVEPNLRVVLSTVSGSSEKEMTAKDSFKVGEAVQVKVEITNLSNNRINIPKGTDYSRPRLFHNGKLISYRKEVNDREKRNYRSLAGMLFPKPNQSQSEIFDLSDYYKPLKPGKYQFSLERRFFGRSDIESNMVTFEVVSSDKK